MSALCALAELAMSRVYGGIEGYETKALTTWAQALELAWQQGHRQGLDNTHEEVSAYISGEPDLLTAYLDGASRGQRERLNPTQPQEASAPAAAAARSLAPSAIPPSDDIDALTPEALVVRLLAGQIVEVRGHKLWFEDGYTWVTNPYGVDGIYGPEPDTTSMSRFLQRMAQGEEVGLLPH